MFLSHYLRILWARKWLVLGSSCSSHRGHRDHAAVPRQYTAETLARRRDADRSGARRARAGSRGAELHGDAGRDPEERAGRVARGQDPRRRAIGGGGRAVARSDEGEDPARALLRRRSRSAASSIEPTRGSNIINLSFYGAAIRSSPRPPRTRSPRRTWTSRSSCASRRRASPHRFSRTRAKSLRAKLEQAQAQLSKFQQSKGIVVTDERLDQENARYNTLIAQLAMAQAERVETETRQRNTGSEVSPDVLQQPRCRA